MIAVAAPLRAQDPPTDEPEQDYLSRWWHEEREERWTITRDLMAARDLTVDLGGFYFQFGLTATFQYADSSLTDRDTLLDFTYDFSGAWRVFGDRETTEGALSWWVRGGRPLGAAQDADFGRTLGSVYDINANSENNLFQVQELYWAEYFGDRLVIVAGRLDPSFLYDFNMVANNQWEQFLADPLVNSPGVPFPEPGFGLDVRLELDGFGWIQGGIHQADGRENSLVGPSLDELFVAVEPTFAPQIDGLGQGHYRLLVYHQQTQGRSGFGFSFNFDQEIGGGFMPFARVSVGDEAITPFKVFASAGLGWKKAFGRSQDMCGAGYVWGDPSDPALRDEHLVEVFYRFAVNNYLAVTPDIQFLINPGRNPQDDLIVVLGLRLMATF
jgi:porin